MRRARRRRRMMSDINVVPYIDVMLVLLIIFMVTTPLLTQGVKVNLPKATAKVLSPQDKIPVIASINSRGQYFINIASNPRLPVSSSQLQNLLQSALHRNPNRQVYVRGDQNANYGKVVQLMVLLQKAGAGSVGLMTDNPDKK